MTESRRTIPSTTRLVAFSAACQYGSFTRAADALCVTQAAISRQVRELEEEIGTRLFLRRNHDVVMTDAAARLVAAIDPALQDIARAVALARDSAWTPSGLTLFTDNGLAGAYVLPLIGKFEQQHPGVQIRLISSNANIDQVADIFDLAIYYGVQAPRLFDSQLLTEDAIFPVASPKLLRGVSCLSIAALAACPLLELKSPGRDWLDWFQFLTQNGHTAKFTAKARFDSYSAALDAALAGHGFLLGWGAVVTRYVDSGLLQRAGPWSVPAQDGIRLHLPKGRTIRPLARRMSDWLLENAPKSTAG